jgi:hypothetical protein
MRTPEMTTESEYINQIYLFISYFHHHWDTIRSTVDSSLAPAEFGGCVGVVSGIWNRPLPESPVLPSQRDVP